MNDCSDCGDPHWRHNSLTGECEVEGCDCLGYDDYDFDDEDDDAN